MENPKPVDFFVVGTEPTGFTGPTGPTGITGPTGPIGPTGATGRPMTINSTGIGSIVLTNPINTSQIYYNNIVTINSTPSVLIYGYCLQMMTSIQEHVGYISWTPYDISFNNNMYFITLAGASTINLPYIDNTNDGFYLYFRRVTDSTDYVTFISHPSQPTTFNIVSQNSYIDTATNTYQCQFTGGDTIRTFRVGTVNLITYWFINTA